MNWHQACELPYYHGSDLGANPMAEETTFKLWLPLPAGSWSACMPPAPTPSRARKSWGVHEMRRAMAASGPLCCPGNLHGTYYIYRIYFPDGRAHEVVDPYARSAGANAPAAWWWT